MSQDPLKSSSPFVALVGSPNTGKTTLFNWLTNSRIKTVNYPGSTVEYALAPLAPRFGVSMTVIDTPGVYSLSPKSEDEEVTRRVLTEGVPSGSLHRVVAVVDATQMARNLVIVKQLIQQGFSVVVALTMADLARKAGQTMDLHHLSQTLGCPVVPIDGLLGGGVSELVQTLQQSLKTSLETSLETNRKTRSETPASPSPTSVSDRLTGLIGSSSPPTPLGPFGEIDSSSLYRECEELTKAVLRKASQKSSLLMAQTQNWDRWLLHPFIGLVFFILIMSTLFTAIFTLAAPLMDTVDTFFSFLAAQVTSVGGEGSLWGDFLGNGVLTSFGAVLVFVPQIFILFVLIGTLEATGYLARAATLIDRPLSFFGMSGRSFVPILSGFACAVPALMATRNISSKRDRFITMMIIPLMTCAARLPVYALLLAFLFQGRPAWHAGLTLTALYLGGILVSAVVSQVLHRTLPADKAGFFMMELPLYRRPRLRVVLHQAWTKTMGYVKRAGPPIFVFALLIWAGTTFPHYESENDQIKLQTSYAGQLGQWIEPVFKPMGVDWRVGVSLISAFAAREVFASALAVIFNVTSEDEDSLQVQLLDSMAKATHPDGQPLFTLGSVLGLLIFVMIALQCTSTTAMMIKELGGARWALIQLIGYNLLAYVLAVGTYHLWS